MAAAPSRALYSRCRKYNSRENPAVSPCSQQSSWQQAGHTADVIVIGREAAAQERFLGTNYWNIDEHEQQQDATRSTHRSRAAMANPNASMIEPR